MLPVQSQDKGRWIADRARRLFGRGASDERRPPAALPRLGRKRYVDLLLVTAILSAFVGSVFFVSDTTRRLLDKDATWMAEAWAMAMTEQLASDGGLLTDGRPDPMELRTITGAMAGDVFRLKMFDRQGRLTYVSDEGIAAPTDASLYEHNPDIAHHVLAGKTFVVAADGRAKPNRPDDYAEAYVPVFVDGEMRGVMEVYIDQTAKRALFETRLRSIHWLVVALGLIALGHAGYTAWLIRRRERSDAQARHLAHHDVLTGLPNRASFQQRLRRMLRQRRSGDGTAAVLMIDLDGFKAVNDTLGHDAGDAVLTRFALDIGEHIRQGDTLARLGGDEFAVIQTGVTTTDEAQTLACRIEDATRAIREVEGIPVTLSASVGIALAPSHAQTPEDLLKCADIALYRAKALGKDRHVVFAPGMYEELRLRNALRTRLRNAVEADDFVLQFQPLHDSRNDRICSFEALVRLRGDDGELISPVLFIPLAEEMDLTGKLGRWVLNEACRVAAGWPADVRISVNLSPQQFDGDIVSDVSRALETSGLAPERLELEITEGLFIGDPEHVQAELHKLRALGPRIVMDDFGTGYSSLSYLWMFPFDKLKVDRSCFLSLGEDETVAEVLRTIGAMSRAMKLSVTAEGIETDAQRTFARDAGYDELQGFLYGRPMYEEDANLHLLKFAAEAMRAARGRASDAAEEPPSVQAA